MKKTQLKEAIKQIVRQAINERKNMVRENDKQANIKKAGKLNPKIINKSNKPIPSYSGNETNPIRKAGKLGFGVKEAGLTSENGNYSEEAELELIKQIGQKVLDLLAMHGAASSTNTSHIENEPEELDATSMQFDNPEDTDSTDNDDSGEEIEAGEENQEDELDEATYKVVSPNQVDTSKENKARKIQTEPKVSENYKVQTGPSCRTATNSKDNPKNVRNPKLG